MKHDDTHAVDDAARRPYRRPRLGRVRLEADQVLTAGCKTVSSSRNSGIGLPCYTPESGTCNQTTGS